MARALPPRPHPDHLRAQARELLAAWRAGNPEALARAAPYRLGPAPRLAHAQLVLAREHGFASWPQLMREVERLQAQALGDAGFIERVLFLALGRGWDMPQPARALALLRSRPLPAAALALVQGDLARVQASLADVHAPLPPLQQPPIVYVAFSGLARLDETQAALQATLAWLLAQGADPNARLDAPGHADEPLPVLYGAVARARSLPMVHALLAAGADPNDNESLYHATEQADAGFVAALVHAGARWAGTNALARLLDREDPVALRAALALGADPQERTPGGGHALHHALRRGRSAEVVRLLLAHGCDPSVRDDHGLDAHWHARWLGDAGVLAALGTATPLPPADALLAACAAGDEPAARALLVAEPGLIAELDPRVLRLLPDQAQRGRFGAVQLMLSLGWPVAVRGGWDASALNQAAFRGDAAMVRLLIEHGAHWSEPNGYGGNALGSCLHAGRNEPVPGGDYAAVLALLLAQGAPPPEDADDLPDAMQAVLAAPSIGRP